VNPFCCASDARRIRFAGIAPTAQLRLSNPFEVRGCCRRHGTDGTVTEAFPLRITVKQATMPLGSNYALGVSRLQLCRSSHLFGSGLVDPGTTLAVKNRCSAQRSCATQHTNGLLTGTTVVRCHAETVRPSRRAQQPRPVSTRAERESDRRRANVAQKGRLNGLNLANEPFTRSILRSLSPAPAAGSALFCPARSLM
jgi:hypothetical protein